MAVIIHPAIVYVNKSGKFYIVVHKRHAEIKELIKKANWIITKKPTVNG